MADSTSQNPRRTPVFYNKRNFLLEYIDPTKMNGLEIGALDMPFVHSPDEGHCEYADFRSTEELRELCKDAFGHHPDFIVPITYNLSIGGYDIIDKKFDWILASHTIEHIPDVIGWLNILASKLSDGGLIFLVVPDKRYIWDVHRNETTMTDMIFAHDQNLTKPSFRQVFDQHYFQAEVMDPGEIWAGNPWGPPSMDYDRAMRHALSSLERYEEVHCSVFTPDSFARVMTELRHNGLIKLEIETIRSTMFNQMDFDVVMRPI